MGSRDKSWMPSPSFLSLISLSPRHMKRIAVVELIDGGLLNSRTKVGKRGGADGGIESIRESVCLLYTIP